jgi:hypothetical protein
MWNNDTTRIPEKKPNKRRDSEINFIPIVNHHIKKKGFKALKALPTSKGPFLFCMLKKI